MCSSDLFVYVPCLIYMFIYLIQAFQLHHNPVNKDMEGTTMLVILANLVLYMVLYVFVA